MFSFFKRFKKTQEPDPAESQSADAPQPDAPAEAPAPTAPPAADAPPAPAQPAAPAVVMTVTPTDNGRDEVVETVEIVPPPVQDASAKKSWLARPK
ncbi:putative cell division protein, partial [Burkholderia sp. TJI49]